MARGLYSFATCSIAFVVTLAVPIYFRLRASILVNVSMAFTAAVNLLSEAFARPDVPIQARACFEAAASDLPSSVAAFVDRRLARLPSRRRGPWAPLSAGLPLAA